MRNLILLVFLCFPLCAQTIDFEKNHLGPNEVIGERIQMGDFFIQANEIMATNYGANFDNFVIFIDIIQPKLINGELK